MAVILRAADRRAVPWKDGGGVTREVAVHPPASDLGSFDWRVSLAEVHQGGPFSTFPEIDRHLAVIAGRLELAIAGREVLTLSPQSAPVEFPGDLGASAQPVISPVSDLNVMTRRGHFVAHLRRRSAASPMMLRLEADTTLVLALAPLSLRTPSVAVQLAALDAVRFSVHPDDSCTASIEAAELDFWLIEIRAGAA
ncbi:MAG TPA: HutD family protein [Steroidobacteraceae bacterium]